MLKQSVNAAVFSWFVASLCTDLDCQLWSGPEGSIWLCCKVSIQNSKDAMFQNFAKGQVSQVDKREAYDACFVFDIDWVFPYFCHMSSKESKGNFFQRSFEVHRCHMLPQWFAGRCVQGDLKDVFANDWRAEKSHVWRFTVAESNINMQVMSDEVTYEEKYIFRHQDARVHFTYIFILQSFGSKL